MCRFSAPDGFGDNYKRRKRTYEQFKYADTHLSSVDDIVKEAISFSTINNLLPLLREILECFELEHLIPVDCDLCDVKEHHKLTLEPLEVTSYPIGIDKPMNLSTTSNGYGDMYDGIGNNLCLFKTDKEANIEPTTFNKDLEDIEIPMDIFLSVSNVSDIERYLLENSLNKDISSVSTKVFNQNIDLCSTKSTCNVSSFNISTNYNTKLEEYAPLQKKIKTNKMPNRTVEFVPNELEFSKIKSCIYLNHICEINFSESENLFIRVTFLDKGDLKNVVPYIQHIIRKKFQITNNVCPVNFKSHGWNVSSDILRLYGRCTYFKYGCARYKFVVSFEDKASYKANVYTTTTKIVHCEKNKKHQLRGVGRSLAKRDIKFVKPSYFRDVQLCTTSKHLTRVGNNQQILSKDAARKLKQEETHALDYDDDNYLDICKMSSKEKWKLFFQNGLDKKIYLFSKKQLEVTQRKNKKLLKLSRNTLFFDATGSVIKKFHQDSKRIFLYSLILHVKANSDVKGILLPVAEAFLSSHYANDVLCFLLELETFCKKNGISWPIAERICTDWSTVLITAVLKAFNNNNNANTIDKYLCECHELCSLDKKPQFVIIQICCYHFFKIVCKDIQKLNINVKVANFFKWQMWRAINICNFNEYNVWTKSMLTILISKKTSYDVEKALSILKASSELEICQDSNKIYEKPSSDDDTFSAIYKNSPFYITAAETVANIKMSIKSSGQTNDYYNEEFLEVFLKKYIPYAPLWTNLMGKFVDNKTRIANSPAEGYFSILKNNVLDHGRDLRASYFIRKSKIYIDAKIREIEELFLEGSDNEETSAELETTIQLEEEKWKRTPKRVKSKISLNMMHHKNLHNLKKYIYSNKKYVLFSFRHVYEKTRCRLGDEPILNCTEFKSLEKREQLYGIVVDIYIALTIYISGENAYSTCVEEGANFFYHQNDIISLPLDKFDHIFVPIFEPNHFTLIYINTTDKIFSYINPQGETEQDIQKCFLVFKKRYQSEDWRFMKFGHRIQKDSFNCGVFVCQFVDCILNRKELTKIEHPNKFRETMKHVFMSYTDDMRQVCMYCGIQSENHEIVCNDCERAVCEGCFGAHNPDFYVKGSIFKCEFCTNVN